MSSVEKWRSIAGEFEKAYDVSSSGRVRSVSGGRHAGRILSPIKNSCGYLIINLSSGGMKKQFSIHRLVAWAFLGPIPNGMHVNHKDGNKINNCVDNLEVVTPGENTRHAYRTGIITRLGERHHQSKITDAQAIQMIEKWSLSQLASKYGISKHTVRDTLRGKNRKHLHRQIAMAAGAVQ